MSLVERKQPYFHVLSEQAREELTALGVERRYRAQEIVLRENEYGTAVYVLLEGWAIVSTATERASSRLILALRGPGELVGEMAMLDGSTRSATIGALGPLRALTVSEDRFRRFVMRNPQANGLVMAQLAARLRNADAERRSLSSLTVLQRLADRLLELAELERAVPQGLGAAAASRMTGEHDTGAVLVDLAQHDLADALGATREAVAKALRLLREADVVRTRTRRIELADRKVLELLAAGGSVDLQSRTS
ncbi:Crp/Fnr family transcriptional regulator [Streptomyces sp. NPDC019890]|uniref:Crp/Fnr family transcriptional regulator n=1 Tax=Streptomyces sp. NPDC019890 TaxID=3365064 RepID=UPI00384D3E37